MDIAIYYNPRTLLNAAGAGWVWDVVFLIILIGLTLSFVSEVFKIQKKEKPDFVGVVWKTVFIVLLYRFLPDFIERGLNWVNTAGPTAELDNAFYNAFSLLSGNMSSVDQSTLPEGCPPAEDVKFWNFTASYFISLLFNFIVRFVLFIVLVITWVVKLVIFSWAWPVLMSINMIGLCAALVIPAFPRQGFGSIGEFFKSVATLALWPVIYAVFMFIVGGALAGVFEQLHNNMMCPTTYEFGRTSVVALAGSVFMAFGIKSIPRLAESVMNHRGMGNIGAGAALAAGIAVAGAGKMAMMSAKRGAIASAGQGLANTGGKLSSWASGKLGGGAGGSSGGFNPPEPKGKPLPGGERGYSSNQAQDLVSQVAKQNPEKGKELRKKMTQAHNFNSGRGANVDQAMKNQAVNSIANDAIDFLKEQGGDKK
jgi:hypothetical protein